MSMRWNIISWMSQTCHTISTFRKLSVPLYPWHPWNLLCCLRQTAADVRNDTERERRNEESAKRNDDLPGISESKKLGKLNALICDLDMYFRSTAKRKYWQWLSDHCYAPNYFYTSTLIALMLMFVLASFQFCFFLTVSCFNVLVA